MIKSLLFGKEFEKNRNKRIDPKTLNQSFFINIHLVFNTKFFNPIENTS